MKSKYTLLVQAGSYESDTITGLIIEVIRHRFHHLINDGKWMD
jgi:hypothetical protein